MLQFHGPVAIFGWFHGLSLGMFPENRSFWDLSEAAPDADVAREMWLFIPKDRWVQVPWRVEIEHVSF